MSVSRRADSPVDIQKQIHAFFEPTLVDMGLGEEQIASQGLDQLRDSLRTLEHAIENPGEFSELNVKIAASGSPILVKQPESVMSFRILPILLSRKRLVLEKIRVLERTNAPTNIDDLVQDVGDEQARAQLEKELTSLRSDAHEWERQAVQVQEAMTQERTRLEEEISRLSENKTKVNMARVTLIGALLGLVGVLGGAVLNNYTKLFGKAPEQVKLETRISALEAKLPGDLKNVAASGQDETIEPKIPPGRLLRASPFRARLEDCVLGACKVEFRLKGYDSKGRLRFDHDTPLTRWVTGDYVDTNFGTPDTLYFEANEEVRFELFCRLIGEPTLLFGESRILNWQAWHERGTPGYAVWLSCGGEQYTARVGIGVSIATRRINEPPVKDE